MPCHKILAYFLEIGGIKEKLPNIKVHYQGHMGFICNRLIFLRGIGNDMYIFISLGDFFHFIWSSGKGSNNKVEILALWGVLFCAKWLTLMKW